MPKDSRALDLLLPEADMIQFSACKSDEEANEEHGAGRKLETKGGKATWVEDGAYGGVFINELLDMQSRSQSGLSYYDLAHRLQQVFQAKNTFKGTENQTPLLYASGKAHDYLFEGFLGSKPSHTGIYGRIQRKKIGKVRGRIQRAWVIDLGAVHGLPPDAKLAKIRIADEQGKAIGKVSLESVLATESILKIRRNSSIDKKLDQDTFYIGYIENLMANPCSFLVQELGTKGKVLTPTGKGITLLKQAHSSSKPANVSLVSSPKGSYYSLIARQKEKDFVLTRREDSTHKPIIKPVVGWDKKGAEKMMKHLEQAAHWEYVKSLSNVASRFKKPPITVSLFQFNSPRNRKKLSASKKNEFKLSAFKAYKKGKSKNYGEFDLELKNVTKERLFVAPLFLHIDFSIIAFKSGGVAMYEIGPGKTRTLPLGILFDLPPHLSAWDVPYRPSHLKLFIASKDIVFDVQSLCRNPLPAPGAENFRTDSKTTTSPEMKEWTTHNITLKLKNPLYKK